VGVFAVDTGTGLSVARRADERFAMCSTFKWVLGAAVLARADRGECTLGDRVRYGPADLLEYAPTTRAHVAEGSMSIEALAQAAIRNSDNTAANLLLRQVGGPAGLTSFVRDAGDGVTRLDRDEPDLNTNAAGDSRDTTSPRAMVRLMNVILCGSRLADGSRWRLRGWLDACETGLRRLRVGFPPGWRVGDKTGTGLRGAVNDVAIAVPPRTSPILIAAYLSDSACPVDRLEHAHATIGRIVAQRFRVR
jgi:beta-lactamase class A